MSINASSPEAYRLLFEGSAAFADVEENGIHIDVDYLDKAIKGTGAKVKLMKEELKKDEVWSTWKKHFGTNADLGSRNQLGTVIFDILGVECKYRTKKGVPKTGEEYLEDIDFPFVKKWTDIGKLSRCLSTFLLGIRNQTVNGFCHPFFNLHIVHTYRSSSSDPNFQNQPIRDPRMAKLIRRSFIPRSEDFVLVEADYGALEFRGAACFWKDPAMVAYASDPTLDIHRDMAGECYKLPIERVSKKARSFAKNQFVFPILYGSYHVNCADGLWNCIGRHDIETADGVGLYDHLNQGGITKLGGRKDIGKGTYTRHVKKVEEDFNKRFPMWSEEKTKWWNLYLKRGWFPLMTGFVCHGVYSYNNLMNTPIQGPSFHCLLWSLIRINDYLKKKGFKSRVIGQIHDSILGDVARDELQDYLHILKRIMTIDIRKEWSWIITPLEVEIEVAERTWYEKVEWIDDGGIWKPKD